VIIADTVRISETQQPIKRTNEDHVTAGWRHW